MSGESETQPDLPDELPIFPLGGALLLPRAHLPLNIFEPRYIRMIDDALRTHRMIGMVQPQSDEELYKIGCAGKIVSFEETDDNRYLITLRGICRFKIKDEIPSDVPYRQASISWCDYSNDLKKQDCPDLPKEEFFSLLKYYFEKHGLNVDWNLIKNTPDEKLISALTMICPFDVREKQALLEAPCCMSRASLMTTILKISQHENSNENNN
jgi:uncharacterized protein